MIRKVLSLFGLTAILATLLTPALAGAANNQIGLAVSPPTVELAANPGDTLKSSIRVDNITDDTLSVFVDRKNFEASGEEGQAVLTTDDTTYSLASWIAVAETQASIPAKSSKVFNFTINVPTNAEPGGHFGSVVFRTKAQAVTGQSGVSVGSEVGSLIFLRVAGDIKEGANIETFQPAKSFYEYSPVTFETRIKNSGSAHFKPQGTITITNMLGQKVAEVTLDGRNVLPGTIRKFETEWKSRWPIGKYTATLSLTIGDGGKTILTSSTTFVVLPYKQLSIAFLILVIVLFILIRRRKRIARSFAILFGRD